MVKSANKKFTTRKSIKDFAREYDRVMAEKYGFSPDPDFQ